MGMSLGTEPCMPPAASKSGTPEPEKRPGGMVEASGDFGLSCRNDQKLPRVCGLRSLRPERLQFSRSGAIDASGTTGSTNVGRTATCLTRANPKL